MRRIVARTVLFALAAALLSVGLVTSAMDAEKRLAIVKALLLKGVVGENSQGLLEFRGAKQAAEVVDEENAARKKEYVEVAKKVGKSPQEAGQIRARQIADSAPAGAWIQDASGAWKKK